LSTTLPNNGFLSDHFHISLIFNLVKEYLSRMDLEILTLHFENKNCFDVSLKTFALEILQLLGFFSENRLFALIFDDIVFGGSTS